MAWQTLLLQELAQPWHQNAQLSAVPGFDPEAAGANFYSKGCRARIGHERGGWGEVRGCLMSTRCALVQVLESPNGPSLIRWHPRAWRARGVMMEPL